MTTPRLALAPRPATEQLSPDQDVPEIKLTHVRSEVVSMLEDKLEELRRESVRVHTTMEQVLFRIRTQGFNVKLDDLKSGRWHKLAGQVRQLQEILEMFEAVE